MTAETETPTPTDGLVVIDKPAGWTSHDVVAKLRKLLHTKKVGHSGTLDPDATGVLVCCSGRGTRLLRFLVGLPKQYTGEVVFGIETSTLDAAGSVTARHDMTGLAEATVVSAARAFVGEIRQTPPMVSAIKVGGQRLHALAREGKEVDREPRPVVVSRFDVVPTEEPTVYRIAVDCSTGTYVRSLAADLGRDLGGGAHLRALRRLAVGPYTIESACTLDDLQVQPLSNAVRHLPQVAADESIAAGVAVGKVFSAEDLGVSGDGPWAVLSEDGEVLAVYERHKEGAVKPACVLVPNREG